MDLAKKLEELRSPGRSGSDSKKIGTPEDWRSRMDLDSVKGGFVISSPRPEGEQTADATSVLAEFGLDPRDWVVSSMRRGKWQKYDGDYLESLRVNLLPTGQVAEDSFDVESLMDEIKK